MAEKRCRETLSCVTINRRLPPALLGDLLSPRDGGFKYVHKGTVARKPITTADIQRCDDDGQPVKKKRRKKNTDTGQRGLSFKSQKKVKPTVMSTFQVGLRPTQMQRIALDRQIETAATAYNWCLWLVKENAWCVDMDARGNI